MSYRSASQSQTSQLTWCSMEKVAELRKSAEKMSQLIRRPSQESITSDSSPIPPFKPIPKITLQRSSSLPRIEVERPSTPAPAPAGLVTSKPQQHDYSLGQNIPPNAKKLRVRSFLWVKPSVAGLDTSIYSQVHQAAQCCSKGKVKREHQLTATKPAW